MPLWTDEKITDLINFFREHEILWNAKHPYYTHKARKSSLLAVISSQLSIPVIEIKKKWHNLRTQYSREYVRKKKSEVSEHEEAYGTSWQYFEQMNFLKTCIKSKVPLGNHTEERSFLENCTEQAHSEVITNIEKETSSEKKNRKQERIEALKLAETILLEENDEFDAYGIIVSSKLRKMEEMQSLYAEKMINDVLYYGTMGRLKESL